MDPLSAHESYHQRWTTMLNPGSSSSALQFGYGWAAFRFRMRVLRELDVSEFVGKLSLMKVWNRL